MTQVAYDDGRYLYYGTSNDTKPNPANDVSAGTPAIFVETDTGLRYIYNTNTQSWDPLMESAAEGILTERVDELEYRMDNPTPATTDDLGMVQIGEGIDVDENGVISVSGGGGGGGVTPIKLFASPLDDWTDDALVGQFQSGEADPEFEFYSDASLTEPVYADTEALEEILTAMEAGAFSVGFTVPSYDAPYLIKPASAGPLDAEAPIDCVFIAPSVISGFKCLWRFFFCEMPE